MWSDLVTGWTLMASEYPIVNAAFILFVVVFPMLVWEWFKLFVSYLQDDVKGGENDGT